MRRILCFLLIGFVGGAALAAAAGALSVEFIRLTPPSGWSVKTTAASTRLLSSPRSDASILIFAGPQSAQPLDLAASFSTSVKGMLQGRKIVQSSAQVFNKTPDGSAFIAQNFAADDAKKKRVFASITVANVHDRLAVFSLMSGTKAAFDKYTPAYNKMLSEVTFSGGPVVVADNPLDRPNGRIEQQKARVNPASDPASLFPDPANVKASQNARKKPGVVSGNIYGADGKPWNMPGSRVTVEVWGLTGNEDLIGVGGPPGGERTNYSINVDQRGHYELKIAGGGYRIKAQALIPYGGVLVPVELDPLDGEPSSDYDLNSFRGIVKDFGLKLTGPRAGGAATNGYNGFQVAVGDVSNIMARSWTRYPKGTHLRILLTPIAPLLDGSQGWPIDIDMDVTWMGEHCDRDGCAWSGVPFSKYRATAKYVLPNGRTVPARVDVDTAGHNLATTAIVEFKVQQDRFTGPSVLTPTINVNDEP